MVTIEANSVEEGLIKVARYLGEEIFSQSKQNLVDYGSVDTGQLLQSGELIPTQNGCIVRYGINYADYVEYGTEPHWTPIKPLIEWARHKGFNPNFAYAVQRKIAKEGTDPKAYVRNAIDKVINKYKG